MAKADKKINEYRMSGASWMYDYIKANGMEAAEKELKLRGATYIQLEIGSKAIEASLNKMKDNTIDTILIMAISVLRDEFDFGQKRIEKFMDRFHYKTDCMLEGYCTWADKIAQIKEELGFELSIRENN